MECKYCKKQEKQTQYAYNATLRRIHETVFAVEVLG